MGRELYSANGNPSLSVVLNEPSPSALEVRWGRFFSLLRVRSTYDPTEYHSELGQPLPFFLAFSSGGHYAQGIPSERGLWVAVSASAPDRAMYERLRDLARQSGHWVHLLVGEPQPGFLSERAT
jgi:hypothetical protein